MISDALKEHWPKLTIIGEESIGPKVQASQVDLSGFDRRLTTLPYLHDQELLVEDACVWIDPVDGTLSYTEGQLDEVSTLIGLSYRNKARLGVIGLPYLSPP